MSEPQNPAALVLFLVLFGEVIVDQYDSSLLSQIGVSIAGITIMCLATYAATQFKVSRR